jgi:hypothetical protein
MLAGVIGFGLAQMLMAAWFGGFPILEGLRVTRQDGEPFLRPLDANAAAELIAAARSPDVLRRAGAVRRFGKDAGLHDHLPQQLERDDRSVRAKLDGGIWSQRMLFYVVQRVVQRQQADQRLHQAEPEQSSAEGLEPRAAAKAWLDDHEALSRLGDTMRAVVLI